MSDKKVYLHDYGRPEYLDGAEAQFAIERGQPYPSGDPVAYVYEKDDAERIVAALNGTGAEAPAGWKLVPVHATPEMLFAAQDVDRTNGHNKAARHATLKKRWKRMLDAAPDAPTGAPDTREAHERIFDMLLGDDGQAYKEAERYLERVAPDLANRLIQAPRSPEPPSSSVGSEVADILEALANEPPINGNLIAQHRLLWKAAQLRKGATGEPT